MTVHSLPVPARRHNPGRIARRARVFVPGLPHPVTQRGKGRAKVAFGGEVYALYRDLLHQHCREADVEVRAWVLMPKQVHFILTPPRRGWPTPGAGESPSPLCRPYTRAAKELVRSLWRRRAIEFSRFSDLFDDAALHMSPRQAQSIGCAI